MNVADLVGLVVWGFIVVAGTFLALELWDELIEWWRGRP